MIKKTALHIFVLLLLPRVCTAHPGKLNSDGGHYDIINKEYHYHNKANPDKPVYSPNINEEPPFQKTKRVTDKTIARNTVLVTAIIDITTIVVVLNNQREKIRLPIEESRIDPVSEERCKKYLEEMLENKFVIIQHKNIRDKDGYLQGEVFWNSLNIKDALKQCLTSTPASHE